MNEESDEFSFLTPSKKSAETNIDWITPTSAVAGAGAVDSPGAGNAGSSVGAACSTTYLLIDLNLLTSSKILDSTVPIL